MTTIKKISFGKLDPRNTCLEQKHSEGTKDCDLIYKLHLWRFFFPCQLVSRLPIWYSKLCGADQSDNVCVLSLTFPATLPEIENPLLLTSVVSKVLSTYPVAIVMTCWRK